MWFFFYADLILETLIYSQKYEIPEKSIADMKEKYCTARKEVRGHLSNKKMPKDIDLVTKE